MRSKAKHGTGDKPLFSITTYFARAKFSPLAKKKREDSNDNKEQSIIMLYKQIRNLAEKSHDYSRPTFLLTEKLMDHPRKHHNLAITTSPFKEVVSGADYLQLSDKDAIRGVKSGAFKKKQADNQIRTNRNSNKANKKKSIQQFFASKHTDNQTSGKNSGTEPTLTKKMPTVEEVQLQKVKFMADSIALTNNRVGIKHQHILNARFDQMRTEANKHPNFKKKLNSSKSIDKNTGTTSRQAKISVNKERKKNSVQLVRSNTQTGHQKTVSQNALFCTKILDFLKKNKVMESGRPKLDMLRSKGIAISNNIINIGEMRRTTTQKTESQTETPYHKRLNTRITLSPDKQSQHNTRAVTKRTDKGKVDGSKDVKPSKSVKHTLKPKHYKTLSNNIVHARSTANLHTTNIEADNQVINKHNNTKEASNGLLAPKFSLRKSYKRSKTNVSEPTSRLTSMHRPGFKAKKNGSKEKSGLKSTKQKTSGTNMLQLINNIDSNQYLESLKAKLTGDLASTKRQVNLKSKLSLHNAKLMTLIGKFSDAANNQEHRQRYKTCNNSHNEDK